MRINRNNYQEYFLDYHEGNLRAELREELFAFLDSHSDLKEEFERFENISLTSEPDLIFADKDSLKRSTITSRNYKTIMVASFENDLSTDQQKELEWFLEENPVYKPEFEILKQTRIHPDPNPRFRNKASLKRRAVIIPIWMRVAAAAVVVIGLISYWFIGKQEMSQIADVKVKSENIKEIKPPDALIESDGVSGIQKAPEKTLATTSVARNNVKTAKHVSKQSLKESNQNLVEEKPVNSNPVENHNDIVPPLAQDSKQNDELNITIHSTGSKANENTTDNKPFTALDDNDLAELGLKNKPANEEKSLLGATLNQAGKLLGMNTHYSTEGNLAQSSYKKTFALGPIEVTRTVQR